MLDAAKLYNILEMPKLYIYIYNFIAFKHQERFIHNALILVSLKFARHFIYINLKLGIISGHECNFAC